MFSDRDSEEFNNRIHKIYINKSKSAKLISWVFFVCVLVFILFGIVIYAARKASAHGEAAWIREGMYVNSDGKGCCGEQDCAIFPAEKVRTMAEGYVIESDWGIEFISY